MVDFLRHPDRYRRHPDRYRRLGGRIPKGVRSWRAPSPARPTFRFSPSLEGDAQRLSARLVGLLGGRAAEQLVLGESTTGAESDLEQATALARQMTGRWGMSEQLGLVSALSRPGEETIMFPGGAGASSQRTLELIDDEVKRLTDRCYDQAVRMLSEHREQLDHLAEALLARETLDEADAYAIARIPLPPEDAPASPRPLSAAR